MINPGDLEAALVARFNLAVDVQRKKSPSGDLFLVAPQDVAHTIGFTVEVTVAWRRVQARLVLGNFASQLVQAMQDSTEEQRGVFQCFANAITSGKGNVSLEVNDGSVPISDLSNWPEIWQTVELKMETGQKVIPKDPAKEKQLVIPWAIRFFGAAISLLPLEPVDSLEREVVGEAEGAVEIVKVKRYERKPINRAACLEAHGTSCKVCGLVFSERYGEIGEGFIHVHHIKPLSTMSGAYVINPLNDLVPVCPNCHAMLHKRKPEPYSIEEMQSMLLAKSAETVEST